MSSSLLAIDEVLVGTEVIQRLRDGAVEFSSANAGNLDVQLRGDQAKDLFAVLKAQFGIASIANIAADDTLTHPITTQLTVTATYTGAATRDVTALATYESSDVTKATVSASGLVTTVAAGSVTITASYAGKTSPEVITVS